MTFAVLEQDGTIFEDDWESAVAGPDGSIILAGFTEGSWLTTINGLRSFAAVSLDATGTVLWSYQVRDFCLEDIGVCPRVPLERKAPHNIIL